MVIGWVGLLGRKDCGTLRLAHAPLLNDRLKARWERQTIPKLRSA